MIPKSKVVDKAFNISENPSSSDQVLLKSDSTQPSGNYNFNYNPVINELTFMCLLSTDYGS